MGKLHCAFLICVLLPSLANAQGENNEWIFGEGVHVSFRGNKPAVLYDGPRIKTLEGSTSVSDAKGHLLFYSDGLEVYDRFHGLMPNGSGLLGHKSSTSSAVAVPFPGSPDQYFLFCVDQNLSAGNKGVSYNIIDMRLNHGRGDIQVKNQILMPHTDEKIAVTAQCDGKGFWVVIHKAFSDSFLAYNIGLSGLNETPVVSRIKTSKTQWPEIGYMKFSPTGRWMVNANTLAERIELFSFDKRTGHLRLIAFDETQYHRSLKPNAQTYYGAAFSAQEKFLYVSTLDNGEVFQYDMSQPDRVFDNRYLVTQLKGSAGAIQMACDKFLYLSDGYGSHNLHRIHYPELKGPLCSFNKNFMQFEWKVTLNIGLPTLIETAINYYNLGRDLILNASSGSIVLDAKIVGGKYIWSTGDTTRTIRCSDTGGIYWVNAFDPGACMYYTDTIRVLVKKNFKVKSPVNGYKTYCSNAMTEPTVLQSADKTVRFIWINDNPDIGLPEFGRGDVPAFMAPYCTAPRDAKILVYPVKHGYVGLPDSFYIRINPSPVLNNVAMNDLAFCDGDTFYGMQFSASAYGSNPVCKWYNSDVSIGLGDSGLTRIGKFVCRSSGNAVRNSIIRIWAVSDACLSLPLSIRLSVNPIPVAEPVADIELCSGMPLPDLNLKSNVKGSHFQYSHTALKGNFINIPGSIWNWFPIPKSAVKYNTDIMVQPIFKGCSGKKDTFHVRIKPAPQAAFRLRELPPDSGFFSAGIELENISSAYTSFLWNLNGETDSLQKILNLSIPSNRNYPVSLTVENQYGCKDKQEQDILIERFPQVFVPNAFSPNGDGFNDLLKLKAPGMQSWQLSIYNSWGGLLYSGSDASMPWDGFCMGKTCQQGVYMWTVEALDYNAKRYILRGSLSLISTLK